jgi:hypothetical protein
MQVAGRVGRLNQSAYHSRSSQAADSRSTDKVARFVAAAVYNPAQWRPSGVCRGGLILRQVIQAHRAPYFPNALKERISACPKSN